MDTRIKAKDAKRSMEDFIVYTAYMPSQKSLDFLDLDIERG